MTQAAIQLLNVDVAAATCEVKQLEIEGHDHTLVSPRG